MTKRKVSLKVDQEKGQIVFTDGPTVTLPGYDDIPESIRHRLWHAALADFIQSRTSQHSKAGAQARARAMQEVIALWRAGEWASPRAAGAPTVRAEVEALARHYRTSIAAVQRKLRDLPEERREALFASPAIQRLAEKIRKEREAAEGADLDFQDLLEA